MKKSFIGKITGIVSLFMILLLLLQGIMQLSSSRKHFYQSADISINQISEILQTNDEGKSSLTDSLKDDYIVRAQACSYIIEHSDKSEQDVSELKKIAKLLEVDEIHLFDRDGSIYFGTNPEYFGYSFDSGAQMSFFKPMLSDYDLSLCQDVTPNTAEGKQMMYALVWREDRKGLVQIGLTPTRLLAQIEKSKISNILSEIPTNDNIYFVADHTTGEIVACTNPDYRGKNLEETGIDRSALSEKESLHFQPDLEGTACLGAFRICGDYEIGVCQAKSEVYRGVFLSFLITCIYLLLASAAIVFIIRLMAKKELEHQKQMEEALRQAHAASEAKSAFLANMSHDIRTPMNAIIGFTDLLEKNIDDVEKRDDYIEKIKASHKYLMELLSNVLEMASIEKGEIMVDEKIWSVEQFNNTLLSVFKEDIDRKKLTVHREIHVEHPYVCCDVTKVQNIFFNIVSNAIKYTPEGGTITMRLKELPSDQEGTAVYVTEIEDTGIGISEEFLPYIFDEFTREKNTTQSKIGGTGLGMPIAKKMVDIMGGSITVESQVGKGTRFTVTLPHRISDKQSMEQAYEEKADAAAMNEFIGRKILLAEDNELNAEIAAEILGEFGFAVEWAKNGLQCVNMLQNAAPEYYDLILMDIQMPRMNGYEATKKIRSLTTPHKDIPIIAMTANAFEEDKQQAYAAGMNGHVAKPVDVAKLLEEIAPFVKTE